MEHEPIVSVKGRKILLDVTCHLSVTHLFLEPSLQLSAVLLQMELRHCCFICGLLMAGVKVYIIIT